MCREQFLLFLLEDLNSNIVKLMYACGGKMKACATRKILVTSESERLLIMSRHEQQLPRVFHTQKFHLTFLDVLISPGNLLLFAQKPTDSYEELEKKMRGRHF